MQEGPGQLVEKVLKLVVPKKEFFLILEQHLFFIVIQTTDLTLLAALPSKQLVLMAICDSTVGSCCYTESKWKVFQSVFFIHFDCNFKAKNNHACMSLSVRPPFLVL